MFHINNLCGLLLVIILCSNCSKKAVPDFSGPNNTNKLPVADAGTDKLILYPVDSVELIGSGADQDGYIVDYFWSKLSGPVGGDIAKQFAAKTIAKNLVKGEYLFQLRVTDNKGGFGSARVRVVVAAESQLPITEVQGSPELSYFMAPVRWNTKLFFLGLNQNSNIHVYDINTNQWTTSPLSKPRVAIGTVAIGNKVLFAGGADSFDWDWNFANISTRIDIYDGPSNTWTTAELPVPMYFDGYGSGSIAAVGNKVIFCSIYEQAYYIYDVSTNLWTSHPASFYRSDIAAISAGNKIFICGGATSKVDVYNEATNSWSLVYLSQEHAGLLPLAISNKVLFVGGYTSNLVDIYNITTQSWATTTLSKPLHANGAAVVGQKAYFFSGQRAGIYDELLNQWSILYVEPDFQSPVIAAGGKIYGIHNTRLWQINF